MASPTRPEPMNASPHHSKVKVALTLSDHLYVAGGLVTGKMEVQCRADNELGIGTIMVELLAIEELTSRDHSATSTFLHNRRLFQGPGLPPSNAVMPYPIPDSPPLPSDYYHARKGLTTFLFRFPLPVSSPSALTFGAGLARVRYEVRASVAVAFKGENRLVVDKKEVDVVEGFEEDYNRAEPAGVVVGENGKVWMQGRLLGGFIVAGQPACVELQVKNHSTKKNSGLSISLARNLHLPRAPQQPSLHLSDTLTNVAFNGREYIIQSGSEGVAHLVFDIPQIARGVKGGLRSSDDDASTTVEPLFEVRCSISIKMAMGLTSKGIVLDLPVTILHPLALPAVPPDLEPYHSPSKYPAYEPIYHPSVSPPVMYSDRISSPYGYIPTHMSPPPASQHWFPSEMNTHPYPYFSPPPLNQHYYYPPLPNLMLPLHIGAGLPARPSSAEPVYSQPLYSLPSPSIPMQPSLPLNTGGKQSMQSLPHEPSVEREGGKGERAARISRHLRMSSRGRSASPEQHRFPMPISSSSQHAEQPSLQPVAIPTSEKNLSLRLTIEGLPGSANSSGGVLLSPRPILSPKLSFDALSSAGSKSERVEILERMAAEVEEENGDMSGAGRVVDAATSPVGIVDKTLPPPPVPSWRDKRALPAGGIRTSLREHKSEHGLTQHPASPANSTSARNNDVATSPHTKDSERTPPTPTLTAVKLSKSRGEFSGLGPKQADGNCGLLSPLGGDVNGLDALEARLVAEVGTRKAEKNGRPDVRSILASPIEIPTVKGRRANGGDTIGDSAAGMLMIQGREDEVNESAISSLTLAGEERSIMSPRERGRDRTRKSSSRSRSRSRARTISKGVNKVEPDFQRNVEQQSRKSGGGKKKNTIDQKEAKKDGRKMRKAVQGRIAAWLGSIDPDVPPPTVPTPPPTSPPPMASSPAEDIFDFVTSRPSSRKLLSKQSVPEAGEAPTAPEGEEKDVSAVPNPRSSGFVPLETLRSTPKQSPVDGCRTPKLSSVPISSLVKPGSTSPRLPHSAEPKHKLYLSPIDHGVKYDVRSARGGRGGKVTAVAAIWASTSQAASKPQAVAPSQNKMTPRRVKAAKGVTSPSSSSTEGEDKAKGDLKLRRSGDNYRKARMVKSTSVPAVVSSSLAVPMLSSTASLVGSGNRSPNRERPVKISRTFGAIPTIEEDVRVDYSPAAKIEAAQTIGDGATNVKEELAFGQARLRELIKKYQG